jgi:hypothetical protein
MASDPTDTLLPVTRESPTAPLAGSRGQSIQRLQVGLFGLAAMVLLVALANIIRNNADQNEATVVPEAAPTMAAEREDGAVSDPLADAGVVPDVATGQATEGRAPAPQR